jgi:hypothetical protein
VHFLHFSAQYDSCQSNWCCLIPFLSSVSPLLQPTSPRCRTMSRFLPRESRRARCLSFIFRQRFISSPPLSSRNQSIESASPLSATLTDHPTPTVHYYKKVMSTLATHFITQELHLPSSFSFNVVSHPSSLHTTTPTITELSDPLSLPEEHIDM